jgi:hypothetical protein
VYNTVGVILDLPMRVLRHRPARVWRLYIALEYLLSVGGTTGVALRIIVGHLVNCLMLQRCSLAALDHVYTFVRLHLHEFSWFSEALISELTEIKGILFLQEIHLGAPWHNIVYCSDSSKFGYSLASCLATDEELLALGQYRERWRFSQVEADSVLPFDPADLAAGTSADWRGPLIPGGDAGGADHPLAALLDFRPVRSTLVPRFSCPGIPPISDEVLNASRWVRILRGAWRFDAAIHMLEARVELLGLRRTARDPAAHGS